MNSQLQETNMRAPIPVGLYRDEHGLDIEFADLNLGDLLDPFLSQSILRQQAPQCQIRLKRSDLSNSASRPQVGGLIFHTGRCGSTLLAHALKPYATVLSEPPALAGLFKPPHGSWSAEELTAAADWLIGKWAASTQKPVIIKLTSWHTLFADAICNACAPASTVFLFRQPADIALSLIRKPPGWGRQWLEKLERQLHTNNFSGDELRSLSQLIRQFLSSSRTLASDRHIDVAYEDLVDGGIEAVFRHFGFKLSERNRRLLANILEVDAKDESRSAPFAPTKEEFHPFTTAFEGVFGIEGNAIYNSIWTGRAGTKGYAEY